MYNTKFVHKLAFACRNCPLSLETANYSPRHSHILLDSFNPWKGPECGITCGGGAVSSLPQSTTNCNCMGICRMWATWSEHDTTANRSPRTECRTDHSELCSLALRENNADIFPNVCKDRRMPNRERECVPMQLWHSAGSLGWLFPMRKYKYIFQINFTKVILSNTGP